MPRKVIWLQPGFRAAHPRSMVSAVFCLAGIVCAASAIAQAGSQVQPGSTATQTQRAVPRTTANQKSSEGRSKGRGHAAAASNSKVEVIGSGSASSLATMDHPLLPIASIGNSLGIRSGTEIRVRLNKTVDSGHVRNGDTIDATLAQPLAKLPAGTPVKLTVVESSPAGALFSYGELSLQVVSIGSNSVLSSIVSAQGKEGKKEQAGSAPERGTEAVFPAGQVLSLPAA